MRTISPPTRATVWRRTYAAATLIALAPVVIAVGTALGLTFGVLLTGIALGAAAHSLTNAFVAWCVA